MTDSEVSELTQRLSVLKQDFVLAQAEVDDCNADLVLSVKYLSKMDRRSGCFVKVLYSENSDGSSSYFVGEMHGPNVKDKQSGRSQRSLDILEMWLVDRCKKNLKLDLT